MRRAVHLSRGQFSGEFFPEKLIFTKPRFPVNLVIMGTEFKDAADVNRMEDSGNSCGSSVVSDLGSASDQTDIFDGDGVQISDLEESGDGLTLEQVGNHFFNAAGVAQPAFGSSTLFCNANLLVA